MNEDGTFRKINLFGEDLCGKALYDEIERCARKAFFSVNEDERRTGRDILWYLWNGPDSPLYGRDKMTTFERYFIEDESTHKEKKDVYYKLINDDEMVDRIFAEFGAKGGNAHIINGHVPVKTIQGEQPMKANGKLFVIDGGFSKAYQPETGIAGYTLVYHSHGMQLVQHEPFQSRQKAIEEGLDIKSTNFVLEFNSQRMMVKDTDKGKELVTQILDLKKLLVAYRTGLIKEKI